MDKKPLFDSDADPKRIKKVADGLRRQGEFESARMLDGYADLLDAQEGAVPVMAVPVMVVNHVSSAEHAAADMYMRERDEAQAELAALKARIDALMLEFCPDDMTEEQCAAWAGRQQVMEE